jgi:hypothetical protein
LFNLSQENRPYGVSMEFFFSYWVAVNFLLSFNIGRYQGGRGMNNLNEKAKDYCL